MRVSEAARCNYFAKAGSFLPIAAYGPAVARVSGKPMLTGCDPTFRLLLATLQWPEPDSSILRGSAPPTVDWQRFIMLANRHRVGPLALRSLISSGLELPEGLAGQLEKARATAVFAEMTIATEFIRLQQILCSDGIDPILLKGPGLSLRAFGELGLRTYRDLDLLIDEEAVATASALLISAGYELLEPRSENGPDALWCKVHKDALFRNRETGLAVELHWRLFDNRSLMAERELPAPVELGLPPLETALVLPLEAELPYLCIHGALHGWSRLRWLADVNALIHSASEEFLLGSARKTPAVAQSLILCRELLGASFAPAVNQLLDGSLRGRWLAKLAWAEILRSGTRELESVPFGSTVKNLSHYAVLNNPGSFIEELRFDLTAQPRIRPDSGRHKGRIAGWMSRHLLSS